MEPKSTTRIPDKPLELIKFLPKDEGGTAIQLEEETMDTLLQQIGSRPTCIVCVCGPARLGKSFLLGYMLRHLESRERGEFDWMGEHHQTSTPLTGFQFRNGSSPKTKGIWVWSRPFFVKNGEGEELAIILMDTQGTEDEFTSSKDMSTIVALSILFSSVMVFNLSKNLQEDTLSSLNAYLQYGTLALEKGDGSNHPFQKLMFLIRDWNNPGEFHYGGEGGKAFLQEKLRAKQGHSEDATYVRKYIRKCFQKVDCFLLPFIGRLALSLEFGGSFSELDPVFANYLEKFIDGLLSPEYIIPKEFTGRRMSAPELKTLLKDYINLFNSEKLPTPLTIFQANAQFSNGNAVKKSAAAYRAALESKLAGHPYISEEALETAHKQGRAEALGLFHNEKKLGSSELIAGFEEELSTNLETIFESLKLKNESGRTVFIHATRVEAIEQFKAQLNSQFPFEEDGNSNPTHFYPEEEIKQSSTALKSSSLEEFRRKLSSETETNLVALVESLKVELETVIALHLSKNASQHEHAEKEMALILETLGKEYASKLGQLPYEENEAQLKQSLDAVKASVIQMYQQQRNKPGNEQFHSDYLSKLEAQLENSLVDWRRDLFMRSQQARKQAMECKSACVAKYREELRKGLDLANTSEELLIIHNKALSSAVELLKTTFPAELGANLMEVSEQELQTNISGIQLEMEKCFEKGKAQEEGRQKVLKYLGHFGEQLLKRILELGTERLLNHVMMDDGDWKQNSDDDEDDEVAGNFLGWREHCYQDDDDDDEDDDDDN